MSKKESFAKLTEGLDKLNEEQVEKSEGTEAKTQSDVNVVEAPSSVQEPESVQPGAEKVEAENAEDEEKKKEEEEAAAAEEESKDEEPKQEEQEEPKEEPKEEEEQEVKKSEEAEEPKEEDAKLDAQEAVKPETEAANAKEEPKEEDKKAEEKEEEVEKSASEDLTEADIVGAFEAVTKSYGKVLQELKELRQYVSENIVKSAEEPKDEEVEKSANVDGAPEEDKPVKEKPESEEAKEEAAKEEEQKDEEVEKSAKDEENVEGKAVDYVSKSNGIPEVTAEEEAPEEEAEFDPRAHVDTVTKYYFDNSPTLSQGQKSSFRSAVQRVKRNQATPDDVELFRQVVSQKEN